MKYDKTVWTKERNSFNHISGKVSIRPVYSQIGQGDVVGYKIFLYSSNGLMRECKWILDGELTIQDTMKKAVEYISITNN